MTPTVEWFFGRGLSMGCGLCWSMPDDWKVYPRERQVTLIKQAILNEMAAPQIDTRDISKFLDILSTKTSSGWQHRFHTTNWDYLLQSEISARYPSGTPKPRWLATSHVFHHNGSAEASHAYFLRSPILLESDLQDARRPCLESEKAFNQLVWSRLFVVVGMSFECAVDRFLFKALKRVREDLPVGESCWVVINPNESALKDTHSKILAALPKAKVCTRKSTFRCWLKSLPQDLVGYGELTSFPTLQ